jgi:hypothetical protein
MALLSLLSADSITVGDSSSESIVIGSFSQPPPTWNASKKLRPRVAVVKVTRRGETDFLEDLHAIPP